MDRSDFIILLVDDEEGIREGLGKVLSLKGYSVKTASTGFKAIKLLKNKHFDLVFLDLRLSDTDGIEVVKAIQPNDVPIVIMTAFGSIETAVKSMKIGVADYIQKPFKNDEILSITNRFFQNREVASQNSRNSKIDESSTVSSKIVIKSKNTKEAYTTIEKVKNYSIPILLLGESGTGKEVFAKHIHESSIRKSSPFVGINCSAIPTELLESELFGHEKGSFSGAIGEKKGKFEMAADGTLFLDEIGDMELKLQAKLLRVLEERVFERVGGLKPIAFNARIIASTNLDLQELIDEKKFRNDFYFRLRGMEIVLPPLREREEDLVELIHYFVKHFSESYGKNVSISSEAINYLKSYSWPGNIRELKNVIASAVILADSQALLLPENFNLEIKKEDFEFNAMIDEIERNSILSTLEKNRFNRTLAAQDLNISRKTLYNKLKKFSIGIE
jgi:two-component system, NtrC family, response regulator AtoC